MAALPVPNSVPWVRFFESYFGRPRVTRMRQYSSAGMGSFPRLAHHCWFDVDRINLGRPFRFRQPYREIPSASSDVSHSLSLLQVQGRDHTIERSKMRRYARRQCA
jgi:hypothetical protein